MHLMVLQLRLEVSGSSASFVSEWLPLSLSLVHSHQSTKIHGIAGISHSSTIQEVVTFNISPPHDTMRKLNITAIIVSKVTYDLPLHPVQHSLWLADPHFYHPGNSISSWELISSLKSCWWTGPPGSPIATETEFSWVLTGKISLPTPTQSVTSHHVTVTSDEILQKFWEAEKNPRDYANLSTEKRNVIQHFSEITKDSRFVILFQKSNSKALGKSCSQAVRRFLTMPMFKRSIPELTQ